MTKKGPKLKPKIELGAIGLGTFPFSGVFRPVTQSEAESIASEFLEAGGRYIETAPSYPVRGVDLGAILARFPRESFLLGTKCVTATLPDGTKVRSGSRKTIIEQCKSEIARLGVEYLDVLQAHITPEDVAPAETMQALEDLRSQGLVRSVGVSNVTLEQLLEFEKGGGHIDFVQNRMSLVHQGPHAELAKHCAATGTFFNQYQVIERGLLTAQTQAPAERRDGDLRGAKAEYVGEPYLIVRRWFENEIVPLATEWNCSVETLTVGWVLLQPQVVCCVLGATSPGQVRANVEAGRRLGLHELEVLSAKKLLLQESIQNEYGVSIEEFRGLS